LAIEKSSTPSSNQHCLPIATISISFVSESNQPCWLLAAWVQYSLLPQHLPGLGLEHHSCRPRHRHQFALCLFPLNHSSILSSGVASAMKSSTPASEATRSNSVIPSQHNGTHSHPQLVKAFTDTGFNNVFEIDNAVDIAINMTAGVPQARNPSAASSSVI